MARCPTSRVRIALVGLLAVLSAALVLPNVSAQFPRPGMQPRPGPDDALPGGRVAPGARPDFPRMPQPPQPQLPDFPRFGGGPIERVWTCSRCSKEIGRGAFPPGTCPHCGARIINGIGGGDQPAQPNDGNRFNGGPQPRMQPAPGGDFPAADLDPPPLIPKPNVVDQWSPNPARDAEWEETRKAREEQEKVATTRSLFWTVLGVVIGLGVLLIIGLVIFAILSQSGTKKRARKPRRSTARRYRDDDDDDDEYIPRSKRRRYDD